MELPSGSNELLHAQAHIWNHIFNFINSMSLKCAVQLNIPDIINNHGGPIKLSDLVRALPIDKAKSHCIYRLMRILIHSGFFQKQKISKNEKEEEEDEEEEEEEGYLLAPPSRLLLKNEPLSMTPFLLAMLDPILTEPWHHVSEWFQNDVPNPFHTAHGTTLWDYAGHEPNLNNFFNDAMASDARLISSVVIKECKGVFEEIKSLVDVGGGVGTMVKAIADAFPQLQCIDFDLPHVVAGLEGSNNLSYVGGDMFEAIPRANAVLLKWILHDWNDEECIKILKRCREAIPSKEKGGKVIIIDMMVDNQKGSHESIETQLFFDMLMMILVTGKEREEKDWVKLFSDADFSDYKAILHNWSDEECLKILKLCKEAIPSREKGGKVIIIDMIVDDKMQKGDYKSLETKLFFDLMMMVSTTGKERTEKEWEGLFKGSGFSDFKITHVLGLRSLIEVYP